MPRHKTAMKNPKIIQLRIPENLYETVSNEAWEARMSRNAWVTRVLEKYIDYLYQDAPDVTDPNNPKMPENWKPPWA